MSLGGVFSPFSGGFSGGFSIFGLLLMLLEVLGLASVVMVAVLCCRGFVRGGAVSRGMVMGFGAYSLAVRALWLLGTVAQDLTWAQYGGMNIWSILDILVLVALSVAAVLLLCSGKDPGLAKVSLLTQTGALLVWVLVGVVSLVRNFIQLGADALHYISTSTYIFLTLDVIALAVSAVVAVMLLTKGKNVPPST